MPVSQYLLFFAFGWGARGYFMNGGQDRPVLYHNRELSWLKFNQRVLEQACDRSIPLM